MLQYWHHKRAARSSKETVKEKCKHDCTIHELTPSPASPAFPSPTSGNLDLLRFAGCGHLLSDISNKKKEKILGPLRRWIVHLKKAPRLFQSDSSLQFPRTSSTWMETGFKITLVAMQAPLPTENLFSVESSNVRVPTFLHRFSLSKSSIYCGNILQNITTTCEYPTLFSETWSNYYSEACRIL